MERIDLARDDEAEISVLGGMMLDPAAADEALESLTEADFRHPCHARLFVAIRAIRERGFCPDAITVRDDLRRHGSLEDVGGTEYLARIVETVPTAVNLPFHVEVMLDASIKRSLLREITDLGRMARNGRPAAEVLSEAESRIFRLSQRGQRGAEDRVGDVIKGALETLDRREDLALPTPWGELNRILGGGLHRGELVIVAARPGVGKTAMGGQLAVSAARRGVPVYFLSLEMDARRMAVRLLATASHLPPELLGENAHRSAMQEQARADAMGLLRHSGIVLATHCASIGAFMSRARRFARQHPNGLLIVDYLQLIDGPGENRTQVVGAVSRGLKRIALELDAHVLACCQLNREVDRRAGHPQLSDLRESGDIEADADVVLMLERPELSLVESEKTQEVRGLARAWIRKNRNGTTGSLDLHFDPPTGTFTVREKRLVQSQSHRTRTSADRVGAT